MTAYRLNESIREIPIPDRMRHLPISSKGYPVPWFVAIVDGVPDFRVIGPGKIVYAHNHRKCWLCGDTLGVHKIFTIGPMCTVNRISAEPPSHRDCAEYAVRACPFLSKPNMRRNEVDMPEDGKNPAGIMIKRNPGVTALWITKRYSLMHVDNGVLFHVGEPERVDWYAQGRPALRHEVQASIMSGLPILEKVAMREGPEAMKELQQCFIDSAALLPAA
jgi:hypothetical protein